MKKLVFLSLIAGLLLFSCNRKNTHQGLESSTNIIYIMADDLGYADIAPFGQTIIKTPALSRLAKEGMIGKRGLGNVGNSGDPKHFGWDLTYGYYDQVN